MKRKSLLVFSIVIASLALVTIAYADEVEIGFTGEGYFQVVFDEELGELVYIPPGGFELLNVTNLGLSEVAWKLRFNPPPEGEPFGWFTITGPNGKDTLEGIYDGFVITPTSPTTGTYDLEWLFTGGTGRFDDFVGRGHTDGEVDFLTAYAEYVFSGIVTDNDDDQGDDD
jgi:hypothetical protein